MLNKLQPKLGSLGPVTKLVLSCPESYYSEL